MSLISMILLINSRLLSCSRSVEWALAEETFSLDVSIDRDKFGNDNVVFGMIGAINVDSDFFFRNLPHYFNCFFYNWWSNSLSINNSQVYQV